MEFPSDAVPTIMLPAPLGLPRSWSDHNRAYTLRQRRNRPGTGATFRSVAVAHGTRIVSEFFDTTRSFLPRLHNQTFAVRCGRAAVTLNNAYLESMTGTLEMLHDARELGLSDPRDRIFAFLALTKSPAQAYSSIIQPDYKKMYLQISQDFAHEYLKKNLDLSILSNVQHDEDSIASDFETWVPQWNTCLHSNNIDFFSGAKIYLGLISDATPFIIDSQGTGGRSRQGRVCFRKAVA